MKTPVFTISLKSATDRRERFLARLPSDIGAFEFVDAHTCLSNSLRYDQKRAFAAKGRPLHKAELGCYSSHYSVWEKIVKNEITQAFVFEDDVVVDWKALTSIEALTSAFTSIKYVRLYAKRPCKMHIVNEGAIRGRALVDYRGYAYGTQGYLITLEGAKVFIKCCETVYRAVDDEMDRSWSHGIPNLAIFPFPIFEEESESTIGAERFDLSPLPASLQIERFKMRTYDFSLRVFQAITNYGKQDSIGA